MRFNNNLREEEKKKNIQMCSQEGHSEKRSMQ